MREQIILEIKGVTKSFGGLIALKNIDFELKEGEILGLIGPNGAGKTTMFNVIAGAIKADKGTIMYKNRNIMNKLPDKLCHLGIARTFQITKPFQDMSLVDNVVVGSYFGKKNSNLLQARKKAKEILKFIGLEELANRDAKDLSIGNLKKLELARALATDPDVLLIDEVIGGLTPTEGNEVVEIIRKIREKDVSIIMIEHVMKAVMSVSDRMIVLNHGEILARGKPKEIAENKDVIEAYLGGIKDA